MNTDTISVHDIGSVVVYSSVVKKVDIWHGSEANSHARDGSLLGKPPMAMVNTGDSMYRVLVVHQLKSPERGILLGTTKRQYGKVWFDGTFAVEGTVSVAMVMPLAGKRYREPVAIVEWEME